MTNVNSILYNELIKEHNKKPRNFRRLAAPTHSGEGVNAVCGDPIWVDVAVEGDTVADIGFEGTSCAICQSSASIMTNLVKGGSVADAEGLVQRFRAIVTGQAEPDATTKAGKYMSAFAGIANLPVRVKCAVLPWHTLHSAFQHQATTTTEGDADPVPGSGLAPGAGLLFGAELVLRRGLGIDVWAPWFAGFG